MIPLKLMKNKINFLSSFSLIEVLIFITILSIFFVAAASVTIGVLRDIKINEHKILATRYASELIEWMSGEKEKGWIEFTGSFSNGTNCFSGLNWNDLTTPCDAISSTIFTRSADLTKNPANDQVDVVVEVSWNELGKDNSVQSTRLFKLWE